MNITIFVAFAMEDVGCRNLLKGQSLLTRSPFEYVDMSVKTPYDVEWKRYVRTRIRRLWRNRHCQQALSVFERTTMGTAMRS